MYQALYRKYRPRTFDEVAGQEHITETLKKQVASDRLSHAYLFIGTRGTGKTSCAKILAKAVNCENPQNGNPCNVCAACTGIDDGSILDVVEIDAASNNSVDNVRALRDEAIFSPAGVKKRVYIIDEVHMLSTSAFNALLKILEEPPEHLMFILATTELRKVPATVLSRCQRHSFRRIDSSVISERLDYVAECESLRLTPDAAALLSRIAEGSMRDGLSLLDQCSGAVTIDSEAVLSALGLAGNRSISELLGAIAGKDAKKALSIFEELWRQGKDPASLLSELAVIMRDVLILSVAPVGGTQLLSVSGDPETLRRFSKRFTDAELLRAMQRIQETLMSLRDNPSPRTVVEICLVSLCDPRLSDGMPELLARISKLEENGVPIQKVTASPPPPAPKEPEDEPDFEPDPVYEPAEREEPEPAYMAVAPDENPDTPCDDLPPGSETVPSALSWEALLTAMEPRVAMGIYNLLTDPLQAVGEFAGDRLELHIANGFAFDMLNKQDILTQFRECASTLSGRTMTVSVSGMDTHEKLAERNIEELKRFKQVKFI
ncbi:MAG: DNA polymerase III subunit gamma/tau [Clostridia bacterium]|nr:DNA polymerase III subunit gamma/tau [Clostridia bacterium]